MRLISEKSLPKVASQWPLYWQGKRTRHLAKAPPRVLLVYGSLEAFWEGCRHSETIFVLVRVMCSITITGRGLYCK